MFTHDFSWKFSWWWTWNLQYVTIFFIIFGSNQHGNWGPTVIHIYILTSSLSSLVDLTPTFFCRGSVFQSGAKFCRWNQQKSSEKTDKRMYLVDAEKFLFHFFRAKGRLNRIFLIWPNIANMSHSDWVLVLLLLLR